jgi:hypothetical protein
LIQSLAYYLVLAFVAGIILRLRSYRVILELMVAFPKGWPGLPELVKQHRAIFVRWPTLLPIGLPLSLLWTNTWASHFVWREARPTTNRS